VPSEHSSGQTRSQGAITKTGNSHARRLLIEAAWHHRRPYRPAWSSSDDGTRRRRPRGRGRTWATNNCSSLVSYAERKKRPVIANVAVARELAGWCSSLAVLTGD
jgi:transposase